MTYKEAMICSFADELESIQKEAGIGTLLKGLKAGFGGAAKAIGKGTGVRGVGKGIFSTARAGGGRALKALKHPKGVQWRTLGSGLGSMAPAAGVVGAGGLATYGAGKAAFGQ